MRKSCENLIDQISEVPMELLQERAQKNDAEALWELANRSNNKKKAFNYWKKAAELGFVKAFHDVGLCYQYGEGVPKSIKKTIEYYKKGVDAGDAESMTNLGFVYEMETKEYDKAKKFYEMAAEFDNEMAINNLGNLYNKGLGVEQDTAKAIEYFTRAVKMGNEYAIGNLFELYVNIGDVKNADKLFKKLESYENFEEEIHKLACLYESEAVNGQDNAVAIKYYKIAAKLGYKDSIEYLFNYYTKKLDYEEASQYYNRLKPPYNKFYIEQYAIIQMLSNENCCEPHSFIIEPNKFVIIGVGDACGTVLDKLTKLNNNASVTVAINCDWQGITLNAANIKIYLKNIYRYSEFYPSPSVVDYKKITDFIQQKLNKNQKIILVKGLGGHNDVFHFIATKLKNSGCNFKVIATIPFRFEQQRRQRQAQETLNFLKEKGIDVETVNGDELFQIHNGTILGEAFRLLDEEICKRILQVIKSQS